MASWTKERRRRGFTLVEVMIAIAIVVVLIGIVAVNVIGKKDEANEGAARIQMRNIQSALDDFKMTFDRYPLEEEGLEVLWSRDALVVEDESLEARWKKFVQKPVPNDVWGTPWGYRAESEYGEDYDLWSSGPDRVEGTDDDIVSWQVDAEGQPIDSGSPDSGASGSP